MLKKWNKILVVVLMTLCMLVPSQTIFAASNLSIYNYTTKKTTTYTGQQVKYTLDGVALGNSSIPGIIQDGTALGSYYEVFTRSPFKATTKYNKAKGTVTITKDGNTVIVTIGSKIATVNGKSVTMSVAPVKLKYKATGDVRIFVPTRFVAENLGYTYTWTSSTSIAAITSPFQIKYNNKIVNYTGTIGKATFDGKNIALGNMPGIIIDNTAMLRAKQVFANSGIGATYDYNSKTKELTLTKGSNIVKLTLGSKTAYVNGKAKTMDAAPVTITNVAKNLSYIMVPGTFVASSLGYDYQWNATTKTSVIKTRVEKDDTATSGDGAELGDVGVIDSTELSLKTTSSYATEYKTVSGIKPIEELKSDATATAFVYNIDRDYSINDKEVYKISSTMPFNTTSVSLKDSKLTLHMKNTLSSSTTYPVTSSLVTGISSIYSSSNETTDITMNLASNDLVYDVNLSEDKLTMYVTVYNNYLTELSAGTTDGNSVIELTALKPFYVTVSEDEDAITLQMNHMINTIGDITESLNGLDSVAGIQTITIDGNMVYIVLEKQTESTYTVTKSGNKQIITFHVIGEEADDSVIDVSYDATIPLPIGITYDDITVDDRYYNKEIVFQVPGNYTTFYKNIANYASSSVIKKMSATYTGGNTEVTILTTKLQGYKVSDEGDSLNIQLGNPKDIYDKIVVIDAGHGGTDPGAIYKYNSVQYYEKNLNQAIINKTKKYFDSEDSDIKVYYSVYKDYKFDLYDRAALASQVSADLFISLHMNANSNTSPHGTEIYYSSINKGKLSSGLDSKKLANIFLNSLPSILGTTKRNIFDKNLVVVKYNTVPAILIELGFMSSSTDMKLLTNSTFQEKAAKAIYDTVDLTFDSYPTGR